MAIPMKQNATAKITYAIRCVLGAEATQNDKVWNNLCINVKKQRMDNTKFAS